MIKKIGTVILALISIIIFIIFIATVYMVILAALDDIGTEPKDPEKY